MREEHASSNDLSLRVKRKSLLSPEIAVRRVSRVASDAVGQRHQVKVSPPPEA